METDKTAQSVQVAVRVRPLQSSEIGKEEVVFCDVSTMQGNTVRVSDDNRFTKTTYDAVFAQEASQDEVYSFVAPLVPGLTEGYNASVFAYGQTGSGKTYTMFGEQWEVEDLGRLHAAPLGVVPRLLVDLFQRSDTALFTVYCSFLEIYNERVYDLLQDAEQLQALAIREDKATGVFVEGLAEFVVQSSRDSVTLMKRGEANRAVRATRMNRNSSRSHCVFQVAMEKDTANQSGLLSRAKLNLCDLAGSEKFDRERDMGESHLREMNKINLSLTTLGKVISCLSQGLTHVPYRDSKLTRLLMDSLGGNTTTYIVATVSPVLDSLEETISTLHFANRAKNIHNVVTKNEISAVDDRLVSKLQREIQHLKELLQLRKKGGAGRAEIQQRLWVLTEENERLRSMHQAASLQEVEALKRENKRMRLELQKIYESGGTNTPTDPSALPQSNSAFSSQRPEPLSPLSDLVAQRLAVNAGRSDLSLPSDQPLQMRIRGKHNIVLTKNTTMTAVLTVDREANRQREQLRRTKQRLLSLERLEVLQRKRIEGEMRQVEESTQSRQMQEVRDMKHKAYVESQKEKVKNYRDEKRQRQTELQRRAESQRVLDNLKYSRRVPKPVDQPCLRPPANRLEALLRQSL